MKTLVFPSTLTTIEEYGISNCKKLVNLYHVGTTAPTISTSGVLEGCNSVGTVYVAESYVTNTFHGKQIQKATGTTGSVYYHISDDKTSLFIYGIGGMEESYDASQTGSTSGPWKDYRDTLRTVKIEHGVTNIGNWAFYYYVSSSDKGYKQITSVEIGNSVMVIGSGPFRDCSSLESVTIKSGSSLYIGINAFLYCPLTTVIFEGTTTPKCFYDLYMDTCCNNQPFCDISSGGTMICDGENVAIPSVTVQVPSEYPSGTMFCNLPTQTSSTI